MFDYDAELRRYHPRLMAAAEIDLDAAILDVGCGTGQTTRAAAQAAPRGHALGIDISAAALTEARRLTDLEDLPQVRFECGDAQAHPLPAQHFSVAISRFGSMFFADPRAAFANIAAAMRPGTLFTQLVWQDSSRQEWHTAIRHALTGEPNAPSKPFAGSAFSMADPAEVNALLTGAGFIDVRLTEVREAVCYGPDVATALQALRSLGMTDRMLRDQDDTSADRALDRLRSLLDARDDNGVWFDSSAWLVTARRRS